MLFLFDVGDRVIAKTFMAPTGVDMIQPGMEGEVIDRDEIVKRHQVRFNNGRIVWATSDQIKLHPDCQKEKEKETVAEEK